jgi:hypothetical protein
MLIKVLCGHSIATRRRLPSEGNVTFEDLMRAASNFDVRTVTIEGLTSVRYLLSVTVGIVTVIASIWSAGLSWSHGTCAFEVGRYPVRAYRDASVAESEGVAPLFCTAPGSLDRHARWGRPYFQQFFGAMPPKPASLAPSHCLNFAASSTWSLRRSSSITWHARPVISRAGQSSSGWQAREWLSWEADHITYVAKVRHSARFPASHPETIAEFRPRAEATLSFVDKTVKDQPFLVGDYCTIADLGCWGRMGSPSWPDAPLSERSRFLP